MRTQLLQLRLTSVIAAVSLMPAAAQTYHEVALQNFGGFGGVNPYGGLTVDAQGNFYGTTAAGGTSNIGVVFKLDPSGQETVLHYFQGGKDGAVPYAGVTLDSAGNLYGTTYQGGTAKSGVVYRIDTNGQETVIYTFTGQPDGAKPYAGLILDGSGNMYGTTTEGGAANRGTVFKIDPSGTETIIHSFKGGADGAAPYGGVVMDSAGNLFGTTSEGGTSNAGTVFKIDTAGGKEVVYNFNPATNYDGSGPHAGVILGRDGKLYGTTANGGLDGGGTVFKVDQAGHETVIHRFPGNYLTGGDGKYPYSGLVQDSTGNFYGTTYDAGWGGAGVIYKIDPAGKETILYNFVYDNSLGGLGGAYPNAGVILDSSGNLYGTTVGGGTGSYSGYVGFRGVVYKINTSGQETVLSNFAAGSGVMPSGGVIRSAAGNLFGTAIYGGQSNFGLIFEINASGQYSVLYQFTGGGWRRQSRIRGNP